MGVGGSRRLLYNEFADSAWPNRHEGQFQENNNPVANDKAEWKIGRATFA